MQESAIRAHGRASLAQRRDIISFAPGYPAPDTFPWADVPGDRRASCSPERTSSVLQYGADARLPAAARGDRRDHAVAASAPTTSIACSSRPDRSRGSISSRACCSIPATSCSSSCPPTPARSPRSATCRRTLVGVPQEADGIDLAALDATSTRDCVREGRRVRVAVRRPELPEPDRAADRPRQAARAARMGRRGATSSSSRTTRIAICTSRTRQRRRTCGRSRPTTRKAASIYLSSFSKTLAPGFRVAWIDAPPPIAAKLEMAKQAADLCTGTLDQRIIYEVARRGILERQLPMLRAHYQREARRDGGGAAARARRRRCSWPDPRGGFFLWADAAATPSTPTPARPRASSTA